MSFNMKEFAEALLKASATEQNYQEIVNRMNSTNNTLVDDIEKLRDGAKLECKVNVKKILEYVEEIGNYRYSAEDEISSAQGYLDDASSSINNMEDEINTLHRYLEELTHEVKEESKEEK